MSGHMTITKSDGSTLRLDGDAAGTDGARRALDEFLGPIDHTKPLNLDDGLFARRTGVANGRRGRL